MDLLARIKSNMRGIDFDYEVELVPDNKYGNKDVFSEEWDGMIGEVVRRVRIFFFETLDDCISHLFWGLPVYPSMYFRLPKALSTTVKCV